MTSLKQCKRENYWYWLDLVYAQNVDRKTNDIQQQTTTNEIHVSDFGHAYAVQTVAMLTFLADTVHSL